MLSAAFHAHGRFCASHPWEVIVCTLTLTIYMLSMSGIQADRDDFCQWREEGCIGPSIKEESKGVDAIVMTAMRCIALLYIYHQFRKLWKLGSKYVLGIAGLFAVFSSLVFSSSVVNFLKIDFAELHEAWPFFLLLIDLAKASLLAQLALRSSCQKEVRENIARGMAVLGPTITLDTLVETLVIGVGTISGVRRLEMMCCFACMSVVVNYFVFMSFYPACLSLVLELSRDEAEGRPVWQLTSLTRALQVEEPKPNPVIQRVKVIMSAGLVLVHAHSRWPIVLEHSDMASHAGHRRVLQPPLINQAIPESADWASSIDRWLSGSPEHIVMLILALALCTKYIFFENTLSLPEAYLERLSPNSDREPETQREHRRVLVRQDSVSYGSAATGGEEKDVESKAVQTDAEPEKPAELPRPRELVPIMKPQPSRSLEQCLEILGQKDGATLTDDEVLMLVNGRHILSYQLEWVLNNPERGVSIRRKIVAAKYKCGDALDKLPYANYDYSRVMGACCENVVGHALIPVGVVGPLLLDNKYYCVPMATTEGCLVASTNRGCRALLDNGGVRSTAVDVGMTRAPVVEFPSNERASEAKLWLSTDANFRKMKERFDSTSRYAQLKNLFVIVSNQYLIIRFQATTGDAMGMNMVSKGCDAALWYLQTVFTDMSYIAISSNFCTDKKPSAVNGILGRGKHVVCEADITAKTLKEVLKTSARKLEQLNFVKNFIGPALACSIGGNNAQAANVVSAIFIATGQDPAQTVTSSNCMTILQARGEDLHASVTMPCIEIGTVGGGTGLQTQAACLEMLGVRGPCLHDPGQNATTLARIVCATVLAGELSLMSALASHHLVKSHLMHNRSQASEDGSPMHRQCVEPADSCGSKS